MKLNPNTDLKRCWFGIYGDPDFRCKEQGTWGWTKAAANKAGAAKTSVLRLARWCKTHRHPDDAQLNEDGTTCEELGTNQQKEGESKCKTRADGDLSS